MCAPCHNRGSAKYLNPHIVDLKAANPVHSLLEHITKGGGPITRAAIRPRASPFGRNDPLDCGPVAAYPGFRQILLDVSQRTRSRSDRPSWFAPTVALNMATRTIEEKVNR